MGGYADTIENSFRIAVRNSQHNCMNLPLFSQLSAKNNIGIENQRAYQQVPIIHICMDQILPLII